jgi:hypothetical protein
MDVPSAQNINVDEFDNAHLIRTTVALNEVAQQTIELKERLCRLQTADHDLQRTIGQVEKDSQQITRWVENGCFILLGISLNIIIQFMIN